MCEIAVIMSVYRGDNEQHLRSAIESVRKQKFDDFKLFLYRDGPVPDRIDDLLSFYENEDPRVEVIRCDVNKGLAHSLNELIDRALKVDGVQFLARMDSDDISLPSRFSRQLEYMKANTGIDVAGSACREFGSMFAKEYKCPPLGHEEISNFSVTRCPFIHPTVIFRRSVLDAGYRYPVDTELTEDMALWFMLLRNGFTFGNIPDVLLEFRLNEETLTRRRGIGKGVSEFKIRLKNMVSLRKVSVKNSVLILSRLSFHVAPKFVIGWLYRFAR